MRDQWGLMRLGSHPEWILRRLRTKRNRQVWDSGQSSGIADWPVVVDKGESKEKNQ